MTRSSFRPFNILLAALWVFCLSALRGNQAPADEAIPTIGDLKARVIRQHQLTVSEIASYLTIKGRDGDGVQPRLARWPDGPKRIVILEVGDAEAEARAFIAAMNAVMSTISRSTTFCTDKVEVLPQGAYAPSVTELDCLMQPHDVVVAIDSSPTPSRAFFDDLRGLSIHREVQGLWERYGQDQRVSFLNSSCRASNHIAQPGYRTDEGAAYFRVGSLDDSTQSELNKGITRQCTQVLPFLVLGVHPIVKADARVEFSLEIMQLLYSPRLHEAMSIDDITRLLESN